MEKLISAVQLPSYIGGTFAGSVISAYDETGCDAMLVSSSAGKVFVCSGQFVWTSYTAPKTGFMTKIDAQPFIV
jgi:phage protein U